MFNSVRIQSPDSLYYTAHGSLHYHPVSYLLPAQRKRTDRPLRYSTVTKISDVNGTKTLVLNATLPNSTTASGGTVSPNAGAKHIVMENLGWLVAVVLTVWMALF